MTSVDIISTIIAGNSAKTDADFASAGTVNVSFSLIQKVTAGTVLTTDVNNLMNQDAKLGALKNNGGPTFTMLAKAGSVVIDAGSNPDMLTTDQRGTGFDRVRGAAIDIGAVEAG